MVIRLLLNRLGQVETIAAMKRFLVKNRGVLFLALIFLLGLGQVLPTAIRKAEYAYAVSLALLAVLVIGIYNSATRTPKKPPEERFHPTKLWKTPYETTRTGLWLRAAFVSVAVFVGLNIVMFVVRLIDGGEISYFRAYTVQLFAFVPFIYWHGRRQYFPVSSANQPDGGNLLLRHSDQPREASRRETITVILGTVAAMFILRELPNWLV